MPEPSELAVPATDTASTRMRSHEAFHGARSVLHRVAAGQKEAFTECLNQYGNLVWSLARRATRSRADAEDAAQDIFIALWRKALHYDPARGAETAFIITLAQRVLIDRYRARRRERLNVTLEDAPDAELSDHSPTAAHHVDALHAITALERLKPEQQRVIRLALWSGLSHQEISQLTGTPLGTIKAHLRRGFRAIARSLEIDTVTCARGACARVLRPAMRNEKRRRPGQALTSALVRLQQVGATPHRVKILPGVRAHQTA